MYKKIRFVYVKITKKTQEIYVLCSLPAGGVLPAVTL